MTAYNQDSKKSEELFGHSLELSEKTQKLEKIQIDLGSDLLTLISHVQEAPVKPTARLEELFQNAKILVAEGLVEDAKGILRKILLQDRHFVSALELMEEIQSEELNVILQERSKDLTFDPFFKENSKERLIEKLDCDLKLHLDEETQNPYPNQILESMFKSSQPSSWNLKEWQDTAIAFITLEAYSTASVCLEVARRYHDDFTLVSLLAFTYLKMKKPIEALSLLQTASCDPKLPAMHQLEVYYWMGRCYEEMRDHSAIQFYSQVLNLDRNYRDTVRRYTALMADFDG